MSWVLGGEMCGDELIPHVMFEVKTKFGYCKIEVFNPSENIHIEYSFQFPEKKDEMIKAIKDYLKNAPSSYTIEEIIKGAFVKRRSIESNNYKISRTVHSHEILVSFEFPEREKESMRTFLEKFEGFLELKVRHLT